MARRAALRPFVGTGTMPTANQCFAALGAAGTVLQWVVAHPGECVGDHPSVLSAAENALALVSLTLPASWS